jgi:glucose dehydrogenase
MTRPLLAAVALLAFLFAGRPPDDGDGEWRTFGRDPGAQRYSPLTQITPDNVTKLEEAWTFDTGVHDLQVTPTVVNGLMYVTAGSVARSAAAAWPIGPATRAHLRVSLRAPGTAA